jgi:hypothetical protein
MRWLTILLGIPIILLIVLCIWIVNPIESFKQARKSYRMVVKGKIDD